MNKRCCTERESPYTYRGLVVHHYVEPEQYIACRDALVIRADTKEEIEREIDSYVKVHVDD
jgi:hypothetical protein